MWSQYQQGRVLAGESMEQEGTGAGAGAGRRAGAGEGKEQERVLAGEVMRLHCSSQLSQGR